ncbi:hypothetical protein, partial [Streptomyces sp. NPDC055134]
PANIAGRTDSSPPTPPYGNHCGPNGGRLARHPGPGELIPLTCNEIQRLFFAPRRARVMKITFDSWRPLQY